MHALIHLPDSLYTYLVCSCLSIQEPVAIKKKAPNHARDSIPVLGYTYTPNSITGPGPLLGDRRKSCIHYTLCRWAKISYNCGVIFFLWPTVYVPDPTCSLAELPPHTMVAQPPFPLWSSKETAPFINPIEHITPCINPIEHITPIISVYTTRFTEILMEIKDESQRLPSIVTRVLDYSVHCNYLSCTCMQHSTIDLVYD